jgi:H+/Cl- antiporter ClcA
MGNLPDSLSIGLWITATSWIVVCFAYLVGASTDWLFPLVALGVCTGIAEWVMRQKRG